MTIAHGSGLRRSRRPSSSGLSSSAELTAGRIRPSASSTALTAWPPNWFRSAAFDLRREVDLLPRREAREERGGDHRHRHVSLIASLIVQRPSPESST